MLWPIDTKLGACDQCNQNSSSIFSALSSLISYSCHINTWLNCWKPSFVALWRFLLQRFIMKSLLQKWIAVKMILLVQYLSKVTRSFQNKTLNLLINTHWNYIHFGHWFNMNSKKDNICDLFHLETSISGFEDILNCYSFYINNNFSLI